MKKSLSSCAMLFKIAGTSQESSAIRETHTKFGLPTN